MKQKEKLLDSLEVLITHINNENLEDLVIDTKTLGINFQYESPLVKFMKDICVNFIKNYVSIHGAIRIPRKDVYGIDTFDYFKIDNNILYRNGHDVKWDQFYKLYNTYKFLKNENLQIQS